MSLTKTEYENWLKDPVTLAVFEKVKELKPGPVAFPYDTPPEVQMHQCFGNNQMILGWVRALDNLTDLFPDEDNFTATITDDYGASEPEE